MTETMTTEWCPHCGLEVEIPADRISKCPGIIEEAAKMKQVERTYRPIFSEQVIVKRSWAVNSPESKAE